MSVDIEAAAQVMEQHASNLDTEAAQFAETAAGFMASAQQAAEQVMTDAKARAAKLLADAQDRAGQETAKAQTKRDEAEYWRRLAARERGGNANPVDQTRPDEKQAVAR